MGADDESPRFILEYSLPTKRLAGVHLAFIGLFAALFIFILFNAGFADTTRVRAAYRESVLPFGLLLTFHFVIYLRLVRPMVTSRFFVFADRLEVLRGTDRFVALYADIAKVFGRVLPHFGGNYGIILKDGRTYGFSATLPDGERILEAIADHTPALKPDLAGLRADLIVAQHGFARFREYFRGARGFFTAIHLVLIPFVYSASLVGRQGRAFVITDPVGFFVQTTVGIYLAVLPLAVFFYYVLNQFIDRPTLDRLAEDPSARHRNLFRERRILRDAIPVYLFALFTFLGLFGRYDLNTLSRTETTAEVPYLDLAAGQTLWIDERANCLGCRHSLHEGDLVVFSRDGTTTLGKVAALSGAEARITPSGEAGRRPASEAVRLPPGKIAVQSNPNGDQIEIIDLANVRGRAVKSLDRFLRTRD